MTHVQIALKLNQIKLKVICYQGKLAGVTHAFAEFPQIPSLMAEVFNSSHRLIEVPLIRYQGLY